YEKNGLTTNAYDESLTYDRNGNIMSLKRKGDIDPQIQPIGIDDLVYTYAINTNQLGKVVDNSNNTSGFNDFNKTGDDYTYDANGNLITDKNKNITAITYNHLNLPKKITFGTTGTIEYIYNAAGQKVQKIVTETAKPIVTTDYLGGFQYKDNILEFFPTAEGYVKNTAGAYSYVFQYKDHLGNVRVTYSKNAQNVLEIIEENNYYPFGLKHKGYNEYVA
ncbi:RHS repeat-associated core domain-containing protein, partial [Flavobacterium circumlabens]